MWGGFTLSWYGALFSNIEILKATFNTIIVALCASIISSVLGTAACIGCSSDRRLARFTEGITNIPMINPEIVMGISCAIFFLAVKKITRFLNPGLTALIMVHTMFCAPYSFLAIYPKIKKISPHMFEAACDLGCRPLKAFFKAVVPEIMPAMISGFFMSFAVSIDDFVVSYFNCGSMQTLPVAIYSMTRKMISPEINALSAIFFAIVTACAVIGGKIRGRETKNESVTDFLP
jgi:spermidine/putrescine transport system permease protein